MKTVNGKMMGAIVGDIIGSVYEFHNIKTTDFELFLKGKSRFTDDTVMTLAVAKWLLTDAGHSHAELVKSMQELGRKYPYAGYGGNFARWLHSDNPQPYGSWGNGAGMRVSPVGLYAETLDEALSLAKITADVTHDHPDGVKGAQAIAACIFLCKSGCSKSEIRKYVETTFGYNLSRTIDEIRPYYTYDVSCQGSIPEAITAFLDGDSFVNVIRLAVSIGGDSDTIACMAGSIAACCYPIPTDVAAVSNDYLTDELRGLKDDFMKMIADRKHRGWFWT